MSRLFETLEKLKEQERGLAAAAGGAGPRPRSRRPAALAAVAAVLAVAAVAVNIGRFRGHDHAGTQTVIPAGARVPVPAASSPARTAPGRDAAEINAAGLRLLADRRYWQAVTMFEKAARLAPDRPEPLINTAVALAELGLTAPAAEMFRKARALAPGHPALEKNLAILERHGLGMIVRPPQRIVARKRQG